MKMRKMLAVLSATAIAVSSMAITAFAASDPGSGTAKPAAISSITLYPTFDYANSDVYAANITAIGGESSFKIDKTTVTVTVPKSKITTLQSTLKKGDSNGQDAIFCLKLNSAVTKANTKSVTWGGTAQDKDTFFDGDDYINFWVNIASGFDAETQKATGLKTDPISQKVVITDNSDAVHESTITVNIVVDDDTTPEVSEGYTRLVEDWSASVSIDGSNAKVGDKVVVDLQNVLANAQIAIKSKNTDWPALPGFSSDPKGSKDLATSDTKFEYTLTEADIAAIATAEGKTIIVGGKLADVKVSLVSNSSGDDDNNGDDTPSNPGYVVITPNDTTAADTTAADTTTEAPAEVVTGANGESVEAAKDVIPSGATLEAKEQTKEEAVKAVEAVKATDANKEVVETIKKAVNDAKAAVMDINLVKDGQKVQPNGTIKVTIKVPEALKSAANLFVYRVEDNGTFTDVKATVKDGKIEFTTSHFSTYIITSEALTGDAVVTEAAATTTAPATTTAANGNAATDDKNQATGVVLAVIPAMLAAAGVVAAKKRK